ncbi:MAG: 3-dehydroquinate synthase [Sphingobium sp.]|nr:3-dehydroquinate synthase [Sphingobium sp.]MBP6110861.1 3-dehydroquinate synthase [Sphingobium sp.]MBP8669995.1 3-dehydroquinate synthase [Sphingobium sp.]MBP9157140.1 3-dehydroquinate synthase [Sphingobium sp.]MCC6481089.1 3-dehydroquinate synthase [Sphingomonadaceae bacterium]
MTLVPVSLGNRSYDIVIEDGLLDRAGAHLAPYARNGSIVVVTDERVAAVQLARLQNSLAAAGIALTPVILPPGEGTKSWNGLSTLMDRLLELGVERKDAIVALGGGVIGDLVGFAAAILKRGCRFVQIPTTLLAQVDSSVGGKTAINSAAGKNLVGAFYQPVRVLIDPTSLDSLPMREVRAGYAEVVKYGLIDDADFFTWCEVNGEALLDGAPSARTHAIEKSVRAKAAIVAEDEEEKTGRRALLNLGHTFGHALEAETGYSDRLLHGEAVAAGMALAFRFSAAQGLCQAEDAARVGAHLRNSGLPASLKDAGVSASGARLVGHMLHDKKMEGGTLPFLLARGIGQTYLDRTVNLDRVAAFLDGEERG